MHNAHWDLPLEPQKENMLDTHLVFNSRFFSSNECFIHVLFLFIYLFSLLHIMHLLFCLNACWLFESMEYSYCSMLSTILNEYGQWMTSNGPNGPNQPIYLHTAYHQHNNYYTKNTSLLLLQWIPTQKALNINWTKQFTSTCLSQKLIKTMTNEHTQLLVAE